MVIRSSLVVLFFTKDSHATLPSKPALGRSELNVVSFYLRLALSLKWEYLYFNIECDSRRESLVYIQRLLFRICNPKVSGS